MGAVSSYERAAVLRAEEAAAALRFALVAYDLAGFGEQVTQPLRDALALIDHSLREARS